jgi:hypothetical protein
LWCWPERELHGTTVLPTNGVAATFSMNLAKKTVTAIQRWRNGTEKEKGIHYHNKQVKIDPIAHNALLASIEKNKTKKIVEDLESEPDFEENNVVFTNNDRKWDN